MPKKICGQDKDDGPKRLQIEAHFQQKDQTRCCCSKAAIKFCCKSEEGLGSLPNREWQMGAEKFYNKFPQPTCWSVNPSDNAILGILSKRKVKGCKRLDLVWFIICPLVVH